MYLKLLDKKLIKIIKCVDLGKPLIYNKKCDKEIERNVNKMTVAEVVSHLENFSDDTLNEIVARVEIIKRHRAEDVFFKKAEKLNELLAPILEMLESLEKSDMLGDDAEYLLGNEFVVKDYGCGLIIDFKN